MKFETSWRNDERISDSSPFDIIVRQIVLGNANLFLLLKTDRVATDVPVLWRSSGTLRRYTRLTTNHAFPTGSRLESVTVDLL